MAGELDNYGVARRLTLLPTTTLAGAGANQTVGSVTTGLGNYSRGLVLVVLSAAAAAAGDTLDLFWDVSPNGGTTFINAAHFTQFLGNGGAKTRFAAFEPEAGDFHTDIDATVDQAAGVVVPALFAVADQARIRYTLVDGGGHTQSFTLAVYGWFGR